MPTVSYHITPVRISFDGDTDFTPYSKGFKTAELDDVHRISRCVNHFVWSGIVWKNGDRHCNNFDYADWVMLDFDSGEMTLAEARDNVFCDMTHIIGTTRHHQIPKGEKPACDRFRVVLLLAERVTNALDFAYTMEKLGERYPIDKNPLDAARLALPCKEIIQVNDDGYTEEPLVAPAGWRKGGINGAYAALYKRTGVMSPFVRHALTQRVRTGSRNNSWLGVAKDLLRMGFAPDEVHDKIANSPTFKEGDYQLQRTLMPTLKSAIKAISAEAADGRVES